ncbi:MAG: DUF2800 domain-containing protein [Saprospiraceae bacterium]
MTDREIHSLIGGSVAKQFRKCPGSVNLRRRLGPSASSAAAREGTRLHALQEVCLRRMQMADEFTGHRLEDETADTPPFTAAQITAVNVVLAAVYDILREHPGAELFIEAQFRLNDIDPEAFGRCDVLIVCYKSGRAWIIDAKYGEGVPVEVTNAPGDDVPANDQCLYYAAGARRYLEALGRTMPDEIALVIAQPRRAHSDGPVRSFETNIFGLLDYEMQLAVAIERTKPVDAPCVPGEHCRFCPGQQLADDGRYPCDAYQAQLDTASDEAFAAIENPLALRKLSPAELSDRYSRLAVLRKYCTEFEAFAKLQARNVELPGYAWVPGGRDWDWSQPPEEVLPATRMLIGDEAADKLAKLITPIQAEKALGDDFAMLADYVTKKTSGPSLMKAGARKKTLTMEEVRAHFAQNNDDAFAYVETDV